jgi:hypothetical protein
MKVKKIILISFLISFLFSVFQDFVFYSIDPCFHNFEKFLKFEKGETKEPICKIHQELHQHFLYNSNLEFIQLNFEENYFFNYNFEYSNPTYQGIFKPPKLYV